MHHAGNPYFEFTDEQYQAVINADHQPPKASSGNGTCVLVASAHGLIGVQDSKLPPAARRARALVFTPAELAAFVQSAKDGDYDHLI